MFIFENRPPQSYFGPPFPPRKTFDRLFKELGPYQGLFYQNRRLVLHSPPLKGIWPAVSHGKSWKQFLEHFHKIISRGEKNHYEEFEKIQGGLKEPLSDKFILSPGALRDFSFLGIRILPTPFGYHVALTPASDWKEIDTIHESFNRLDLEDQFLDMTPWFTDIETEILISEAIRLIPQEILREVSFHRQITYQGSLGQLEAAQLIYREKKEKWIRDILEGETEEPIGPTVRAQAYVENGDILMRLSFFVGQLYPLFWASMRFLALEHYSLPHFQDFVRAVSDRSVTLARGFSSPIFDFAQYWIGQGYSTDGMPTIAEALSPTDPYAVPIIPIWGLTSDSIGAIRRATRVSDPLVLDWEKGLAILMLRNCTIENAFTTVMKHVTQKLNLPVDPPMTVAQFLHTQ